MKKNILEIKRALLNSLNIEYEIKNKTKVPTCIYIYDYYFKKICIYIKYKIFSLNFIN